MYHPLPGPRYLSYRNAFPWKPEQVEISRSNNNNYNNDGDNSNDDGDDDIDNNNDVNNDGNNNNNQPTNTNLLILTIKH